MVEDGQGKMEVKSVWDRDTTSEWREVESDHIIQAAPHIISLNLK